MTDLHDQFAMAAMQGMSANPNREEWTFAQVAEWAYKQADAMIAEREKGSSESVYSIKQDLIKRLIANGILSEEAFRQHWTVKHLLKILIDKHLPF